MRREAFDTTPSPRIHSGALKSSRGSSKTFGIAGCFSPRTQILMARQQSVAQRLHETRTVGLEKDPTVLEAKDYALKDMRRTARLVAEGRWPQPRTPRHKALPAVDESTTSVVAQRACCTVCIAASIASTWLAWAKREAVEMTVLSWLRKLDPQLQPVVPPQPKPPPLLPPPPVPLPPPPPPTPGAPPTAPSPPHSPLLLPSPPPTPILLFASGLLVAVALLLMCRVVCRKSRDSQELHAPNGLSRFRWSSRSGRTIQVVSTKTAVAPSFGQSEWKRVDDDEADSLL